MNLVDIILLAIALGIDCLVASFAQGVCYKENRWSDALKLALSMGFFQGLLPVAGFVATDYIYNYIYLIGKWIVFSIFLIMGLKFIFESFLPKETSKCIGLKSVIALGIASSIDALVSGATLNLTHTPLLLSCIIIGIVSFLMSMFGSWFAGRTKLLKSQWMEILGGMILLFLAIKSLI